MNTFQPIPAIPGMRWSWPTENQNLIQRPERFFAATRANPDYGKPGWTRDCGNRFHKGCDIAPVRKNATGQTIRLTFTDCEREFDYDSEEPTWVPLDVVYAVFEADVEEACHDESQSDFGKHVVLCHQWPGRKTPFFTLYGHLAEVLIKTGDSVHAGNPIGIMGTTSRIPDARRWMAAAPHLHFEAWDDTRRPYDPVAFLRMGLQG